MNAQTLVEQVLQVAKDRYPEWTHSEHMAWTAGFLARFVLRKNHMDNIVYAELNHTLNTIVDEHRFKS